MPGSTNILQFNPTATNQESDAAYSSDTLRANGAANSALLPSVTFNKLMYQVSTFCTAIAQAMVNKGYTVSDANLATLTSTMQNLMSLADMTPYALLNGPNFTSPTTGSTPASGQANSAMPNTFWVDQYFAKLAFVAATYLTQATAAATYATNTYVNGTFATVSYVNGTFAPNNSPTLVTPFTNSTPAAGDATARIPNTAWVNAYFATIAYVNGTFATVSYVNGTFAPNNSPGLTGTPTAPTQASTDNSTRLATTAFVKNLNYQANLGFTPVQQGGGAGQSPNKLYIGWDGGGIRVQVDNFDAGRVAFMSYSPASIGASYGWSRMANGQLMQWGTIATDPGYSAGAVSSTNYPVAFAAGPSVVGQLSNSGVSSDSTVLNIVSTNTGYFSWAASQNGQHAFFWMAIGN